MEGMAESRHGRRRSTGSRRRLGFGLVLGLIATILALGALVPAFADDAPSSGTQDATSQDTSATTAPPQTTATPDTKPAENPPSDTQAKQDVPQQSGKFSVSSAQSSDVVAQTTTTIQYTGQGTTGGACDTFLDPADSPVSFDPATQQVWQFNLTQTAAGATMSGSFSDGTTVTNKAEDTHTGKVSKWFIVTAKGATVVSASATYTPDGDNAQFVVSHCWGDNTPATGSLTVTKSVVGSPPGAATFTVVVDCNDGSGHDRSLTFDSAGSLTGGGPLPITGIPSGTQCSVTETGTGGASSVTYTPGGNNPPTVTIAASQQSSVTVTNTFTAPETGSLTVTKLVAGAAPGGAGFTVAV